MTGVGAGADKAERQQRDARRRRHDLDRIRMLVSMSCSRGWPSCFICNRQTPVRCAIDFFRRVKTANRSAWQVYQLAVCCHEVQGYVVLMCAAAGFNAILFAQVEMD
jgi:hypothetical protein